MSKQKNMTGQIATLKKVMHYLKHYIPILILSVVLATATVALTLYFPILTGRAIDLILDKGNVDFPGILAIAKEGAIVIGITAAAQWIMNMSVISEGMRLRGSSICRCLILTVIPMGTWSAVSLRMWTRLRMVC